MTYWHGFDDHCSDCESKLSPEFARCGECSTVRPELVNMAQSAANRAGRCLLCAEWTDVELPEGCGHLAAAAVLRFRRVGWMTETGRWTSAADGLVSNLSRLREAPRPRDPHRTLRAAKFVAGVDALIRGNVAIDDVNELRRFTEGELRIPNEVFSAGGRSQGAAMEVETSAVVVAFTLHRLGAGLKG